MRVPTCYLVDLQGIVALAESLPDLDAADGDYYFDGGLLVRHSDGYAICRIFWEDVSWAIDFSCYGDTGSDAGASSATSAEVGQ